MGRAVVGVEGGGMRSPGRNRNGERGAVRFAEGARREERGEGGGQGPSQSHSFHWSSPPGSSSALAGAPFRWIWGNGGGAKGDRGRRGFGPIGDEARRCIGIDTDKKHRLGLGHISESVRTAVLGSGVTTPRA